MSTRFWLLGVVGLMFLALLAACGSKYSASSDGLVLVGSQGSNVIQTFSFNLGTGHVAGISGPPSTSTQPSSMVVDATGSYAYVILAPATTGDPYTIGIFKVDSGGTLTQSGDGIPLNVGPTGVNVVPNMISRDAAGKFLFVADRATTDSAQQHVPGSVSVFTLGSGGSLSEVAGSPFFTSPPPFLQQSTVDIVSVAATPTVFPSIGLNGTQAAVCSVPGNNPPTTEYLYAVDGLGNQVFEFEVDTSSGTLGIPVGLTAIQSAPTDQVPVSIAVDPCDRFAYVSNSLTNKVSGYTICSALLAGTCDFIGQLVPVAGSPFSLSGSANGIGPLVVDPFGNTVYVVGTLSNTVSPLKISPVSGSLTALSPATVATGSKPTSIAIRGDDNWLFVTNYQSASVSQYSITPATGTLSALAAIQTENNPWGVAVK